MIGNKFILKVRKEYLIEERIYFCWVNFLTGIVLLFCTAIFKAKLEYVHGVSVHMLGSYGLHF